MAALLFVCFTAWVLFATWQSGQQIGALFFIGFSKTGQSSATGATADEALRTTLSDDAVAWEAADTHDKIHLRAFSKSWCTKRFLFLENNLEEHNFLAVPDGKKWLKTFRQNLKSSLKTGWALPSESNDIVHYHLPRHIFLQEQKPMARPPSLLGAFASLAMWGAFPVIFVPGLFLELDANAFEITLGLTLASAALVVLHRQFQIIRKILFRKRNKATIGGRDFEGLSHGMTAYEITQDRIGVTRRYFKQSIDWSAIKSAHFLDDWYVLRSEHKVLAIVPDTKRIAEKLRQLDLIPPAGPWTATRNLNISGRAA